MKKLILTLGTLGFSLTLFANEIEDVCATVTLDAQAKAELHSLKMEEGLFPRYNDSIEEFSLRLKKELDLRHKQNERLFSNLKNEETRERIKKQLNNDLRLRKLEKSLKMVSIAQELSGKIRDTINQDLRAQAVWIEGANACLELKESKSESCMLNSSAFGKVFSISRAMCEQQMDGKIQAIARRYKEMRQVLALNLLARKKNRSMNIRADLRDLVMVHPSSEKDLFGQQADFRLAALTEKEISEIEAFTRQHAGEKGYSPEGIPLNIETQYFEIISNTPMLLAFNGQVITTERFKQVLDHQLENYKLVVNSKLPDQEYFLFDDYLVEALARTDPGKRGDYCMVAKEIMNNFDSKKLFDKVTAVAMFGAGFYVPFANVISKFSMFKKLVATLFVGYAVGNTIDSFTAYHDARNADIERKRARSLCKATFMAGDGLSNSRCDMQRIQRQSEEVDESWIYNAVWN